MRTHTCWCVLVPADAYSCALLHNAAQCCTRAGQASQASQAIRCGLHGRHIPQERRRHEAIEFRKHAPRAYSNEKKSRHTKVNRSLYYELKSTVFSGSPSSIPELPTRWRSACPSRWRIFTYFYVGFHTECIQTVDGLRAYRARRIWGDDPIVKT